MSAEDPISAYMRELRASLRVRGPRRRRIVCEIDAHLRERVDASECSGDAAERAREAVARFGDPREIAGQINATHRRRGLGNRRLIVLAAAWACAMAMGSATVWAAVGGNGGAAHLHRSDTDPGLGTPSVATPNGAASRRRECALRPGEKQLLRGAHATPKGSVHGDGANRQAAGRSWRCP